MFKEFPSLVIQIFLLLVVAEYYVVCTCLLVDQMDKGSCNVA